MYVRKHAHIQTYVSMCIYVYICDYMCIYVCIYDVYVYMVMAICMYIWLWIWLYVYMYVWMCICMYIWYIIINVYICVYKCCAWSTKQEEDKTQTATPFTLTCLTHQVHKNRQKSIPEVCCSIKFQDKRNFFICFCSMLYVLHYTRMSTDINKKNDMKSIPSLEQLTEQRAQKLTGSAYSV